MNQGNLQYCTEIIGAVCSHWLFKAVGTTLLILFKFLFDIDQIVPMASVIVLIIIDFLTGTSAAWVSGERLTSKKAKRSALKAAEYFLLIAAGRVSEYAVPLGFLDDTIIGFIVLTELLSVMENLQKMGYPIPANMFQNLRQIQKEK